MIDGILLIDKEEGITSYDVIRKLKKVLERGQKIGHAGTLDPFATGLLVILLGRATKLMDTFHTLDKEYEVTAKLGYATDTQDVTGKVINENSTVKPTKEDIDLAIKDSLLGNIVQIPPMYSAKKVDGKRSYDLAREGKSVVLAGKEVTIREFSVLSYVYPNITCRVLCSTGTYVRTLINDLGIKVGTFATATELRRISIGGFNLNSSFPSSNISEENIESMLGSVIDISKVNEVLSNGER
jgi:tRNA pseudouridine55 synthase